SGIGTMSAGERDVILQFKEPGSRDKQTITRTLEVRERTVVDFALTSPTPGSTVGTAFEFRGDATTDTIVNVIRPNGSGVIMDNVEANGKGKWSGTATLEPGRTHTVRLQYKEPGKNKVTMDFQLTVP
ncbi:hypothetical protein ACIPEP_00825, partial [Curtobacterium sp. NPDC087082]|uniref:hypothetical protein n=1 Tax=Curtobacterium sp. NPDC087082 TaxID=3363966 RepID=UPI00382EFC5B